MPQDLSALIARLRTARESRLTHPTGSSFTFSGWKPNADALAAAAALEAQAAEIARLTAERDAFKQSLYAELDTNLRLRELGGAKPDEPMTPFLERVIA